MLTLAFFLFLLTAVGAGVVAYASYTHRGLPLPGSPGLNSRVDRWADTVAARVGGPLENTAISGALIDAGVLLTAERDVEARHWFVRAEQRVIRALPASAQRRLIGHLPGTEGMPLPSDAREDAPRATGTPSLV